MNIRNPYKLIEKANNTFNLYLDNYDEIEEYLCSSKKDQIEIKKYMKLILEEQNNHQNNSKNINL